MTKQLPQEIQAIVEDLSEIILKPFVSKYPDLGKEKEFLSEMIITALHPYLSLPKQEQYDIDDIMRQINSQGKNENFLSTEQSQRIRRVLKNNLIKQEQEDTTPIEKIKRREFVLEGERPCNTLLTDANMSRIDTMLSDVIEVVNSLISNQTNE